MYRNILSVNQLSVYGAVAAVCEEFEGHQDRSGEPEILMDQSIFLGEIKAEALLQNEDSTHDQIGSRTFNKLIRFHQKVKWVDSLRKQDFCVLLKLDNVSWPRTLVILDNFVQWLVAITLYLQMIQLLNQKDGFKEIWELDLYWKSRPVFSSSNMGLKFESGLWNKTILNLGSEFPMERSNVWAILFKTTQKFLQIHKKSKYHKQASRWLQPDQRQKQNPNREYSLGLDEVMWQPIVLSEIKDFHKLIEWVNFVWM